MFIMLEKVDLFESIFTIFHWYSFPDQSILAARKDTARFRIMEEIPSLVALSKSPEVIRVVPPSWAGHSKCMLLTDTEMLSEKNTISPV